MPKNKKQHDLDVRDVSPVIEESIRRLPNGDLRLSVSRFLLSHVFLAGFCAPDISERMSSDYSGGASMPGRDDTIAFAPSGGFVWGSAEASNESLPQAAFTVYVDTKIKTAALETPAAGSMQQTEF